MSNKRVFTTVLKSQPLPPKAGDKASEVPSDSAPSGGEEPPVTKHKPSLGTEDFISIEDIPSDDVTEQTAVSEIGELPVAEEGVKKTGGKAARPLLTHFLAECVTKDAHEIMKGACVKREKVHISMAVMRLETEERKQDAINAIKIATKELLEEEKGGIKMQPSELGSFPGVLHLKMDEGTSTVLRRYYELLSTELKGRNIQMAKEKSSEFKPHATVIKAAQGMRRVKKYPDLRKKKKEIKTALKIPSVDDIKAKLGDDANLTGDTVEAVEKVELCSMIGELVGRIDAEEASLLEEKQADGFFAVNYTLPLDEPIEVTEEMRQTIAPPPSTEPKEEAKAKKTKKDKKPKKGDSESDGGEPCRLEVRVTSPDFMTLCADIQEVAMKEAPKKLTKKAQPSKDKLRIILNDLRIPTEKTEVCVSALKSAAEEFLKEEKHPRLAGMAIRCLPKGVALQLTSDSANLVTRLRNALDEALTREGVVIDNTKQVEFDPSILLLRTAPSSAKLRKETEEILANNEALKSELANAFDSSLELRLFTMIGSGIVLLSTPLLFSVEDD
ncbi:conserved hypothetical protein [Perkinsus marinus ATCC 50983]|uniref:A-kinase anchor protein 7-like phosphoesterase domain-containing protein n=1 Tax=Perkinsus marinus (strain ATCC 50983 / TXsc) TaxID=423536 RepID=C5L7A6_PERM5|nr:conserved hypothetical protein [Perkinsus marinus ATCC 50983]EER07368.1 conserved hypothetical protein [Perkinsus marinus ATCC 50983]|eukprot:XP_002775552.1 conserved hypothetical protein [Perkinsus marinus ATCC 50983]